MCLAYFGGILWLIWCQYAMVNFLPVNTTPDSGNSFLIAYDLNYIDPENPRPRYNVITTAMYFMMTTMSTVGFGDLYPKADAERLVCILIFLIGGSFFSFVMSDFL
jgi:hypothetical protein